MCVIVYKPREVEVDMEVLKECWDSNRNGAGMMFPMNGKLKVAKGFMKWRSFKRFVKRQGLKTLKDLPIAFHFRIATHGSVTASNTHPFQINEGLAMVHNGVISKMNSYISKEEDISDSEMFARVFVKEAFNNIGIGALQGGMPINELFSNFIGTGNKLLFMDDEGEVAIVNEFQGSWPKTGLGEGMWFSNMHWKSYTGSVTYKTKHREVTSYVEGRRVTKKYDRKTGKLVSTTYGEPSKKGSGFGFGSYIGGASKTKNNGHKETEEEHVNKYRPSNPLKTNWKIDDKEEWYCLQCASFFDLGMCKRSYWTNGMKDRVVECPECGDSNTVNADELDSATDGWWNCYNCGNQFKEGDEGADVVEGQNGEERLRCTRCWSSKTYLDEEEIAVTRAGPDYFTTPLLGRGEVDA